MMPGHEHATATETARLFDHDSASIHVCRMSRQDKDPHNRSYLSSDLANWSATATNKLTVDATDAVVQSHANVRKAVRQYLVRDESRFTGPSPQHACAMGPS